MICPHCGATVKDGQAFCTHCGTKLPTEPSGTSQQGGRNPGARPNICPRCGSTIPANSEFCPHCGTRLAADAPSASDTQAMPVLPAEQATRRQAVPSPPQEPYTSARQVSSPGGQKRSHVPIIVGSIAVVAVIAAGVVAAVQSGAFPGSAGNAATNNAAQSVEATEANATDNASASDNASNAAVANSNAAANASANATVANANANVANANANSNAGNASASTSTGSVSISGGQVSGVGYSLSVPSTFSVQSSDAAGNATLTDSASPCVITLSVSGNSGETVSDGLAAAKASASADAYTARGSNWYVVSDEPNGHVYYVMTYVEPDRTVSLRFDYSSADKAQCDPIINSVQPTFKVS